MPVRWVLSPTVRVRSVTFNPETFEPIEGNVLMPKVATLVDLGKPDLGLVDEEGNPIPTNRYDHSSVVLADNWSLSFVRFIDPTTMDADPECINVLGRDYEDEERFLERTPRLEGWKVPRLNGLKAILSQRGADTSDLTADSPLWTWLERLGKRFGPDFQPRGTWVGRV